MADVKKTTSGQKSPATAGKPNTDEVKKVKTGNALTAAALEGMETAPLPESTPPPGQPGFHWGM